MNNYAFNKYAGEFLKLAQIANYQGRVRALMDVGFSKTAAEKIAMTLGEQIARQAEMGVTGNKDALRSIASGLPGMAAADIDNALAGELTRGRGQAQAAELVNALSHEGKTRLPAYLPGGHPNAMVGTEKMLQSELSALEKLPKRERMFERGMKERANNKPGKTITKAFHGAIDAADARKMQEAGRGAQLLKFLKTPKGMGLAAALGLGGAGAAAYGLSQDEPTLLERLQGLAG